MAQQEHKRRPPVFQAASEAEPVRPEPPLKTPVEEFDDLVGGDAEARVNKVDSEHTGRAQAVAVAHATERAAVVKRAAQLRTTASGTRQFRVTGESRPTRRTRSTRSGHRRAPPMTSRTRGSA